MGFFSSTFTNISNGLTGKGRTSYFARTTAKNRAKQKKGGYCGGWGAIAFGNIINAHSSDEEIVSEFDLDNENAAYGDAYARAYDDGYQDASIAYQEFCDYFLAVIDELSATRNALIEESELLAEQAAELETQAQELMEQAEMSDDPEEIADLLDEAEQLLTEAEELREQSEALAAQALELEAEIDSLYAELEMMEIEDFLDYDAINEKAHELALELANSWIDGEEWIPAEVLDWSYYDVSDHNM